MEREVWSEECGEWSVEYGVGIVDCVRVESEKKRMGEKMRYD